MRLAHLSTLVLLLLALLLLGGCTTSTTSGAGSMAGLMQSQLQAESGPLQGQQIRASEDDTGTYLMDRFDAIATSHTEWNIEGIPQTLDDTIKFRFADGSTFTIITVTRPGESSRSYVGEVLIRRVRR